MLKKLLILIAVSVCIILPFMNNAVERHVAKDAITQYEIVKRQGDKIATCVYSGIVAAAWLQAKNEDEYKKWKAIEENDCRMAGIK